MNPERWRQVEELYHSALERAPDTRQAFLEGACRQDTDLRREVESLLTKGEQAGRFLETPAIGIATLATEEATQSMHAGRFGAYQILAQLGAGGMGEVYRAHDSKLGRDVAIKTLPRAFANDPERLARFRREARVLASLNHPNIAAIYGLEESEGANCLILELVEGETLKEWIERTGPLPLPEALDIARQIAEALDAAHQKGIVHRDLKPANVKVSPEGRVKVLDFGLAKAVAGEEERQNLSQSSTATGFESMVGQILGTPAYMSPEQARAGKVDKRTDVWAFGCLLYELLTAKPPFYREALSDTIAAVLEREPDWKALPPATPARIAELLRRCLQKDADRRPQEIAEVRGAIEEAAAPVFLGAKRWRLVAGASVATAVVAIGAALWMRDPAHMPDRSQWVQLTKFPDSVSQPALSPDGRMLAFIRGNSTFFGPGQVYVKMLPDGEPVQLTHDSLEKMSPAFSPDGARIAYTALDPQFNWDTWVVSTLGGESQRWLRNASGLVWTGSQQILFSEIRKSPHMGIVAAQESRIASHDVYLPAQQHGMAHRSYASPDGKWVLLVEMDNDHIWLPCRLVPADGSSPGRQVGPPGAPCTSGAWSSDGKWMYFSSQAGGLYHLWRQRLQDSMAPSTPEQFTSGPTEEEGIAMAPDGHSIVTAVALQSGSVWVHDPHGERQISLEGSAADPRFTPDGKKLCYQVKIEARKSQFSREPGEVRVADLASGRSEPLVSGLQALDYDISADGQQVVMEVEDREGKPRLWLAPLERQSSPHQIPNVQGRSPRFGPRGEVFFRYKEGSEEFVYRVRQDGTGLGKAVEQPIPLLGPVSPDGRWIVGWAPTPGNGPAAFQAFPLGGGPPVLIAGMNDNWVWSPDGRSLSFAGGPIGAGRSYIVPLPAGESLPRIPAGGFRSEQEVALLPGAHRIAAAEVVPGPSPDVYAFHRGTTQRNLYRIPIP